MRDIAPIRKKSKKVRPRGTAFDVSPLSTKKIGKHRVKPIVTRATTPKLDKGGKQTVKADVPTNSGRGLLSREWHKHPFGLPIALFLCLSLASGLGLYYALKKDVPTLVATDTRLVIVSVDGRKQTVPTDAKNVGQLLKKLNIKISEFDRVEPAKNEVIVQDNTLINVYRSVPVTIEDGGRFIHARSAGATARSVIAQSGITLYPEDNIKAEVTNNMIAKQSLGHLYVIDRATPINLTLYGSPQPVRTHSKTVGALLKEKKVKLDKDDFVKPTLDTPLSSNMSVAVTRNGIQTITVTEDIPAPIETVIDGSLSFGSSAVRQQGSPGKKVNTYQINVQQGVEVSRVLVQSVTTVEPVKQIVAKGNTVNIPANKQAVLAAAGVSPSDYAYVDYIFSRESGWNAAAASRNGYYGLGQTNLAKLSSACPNWQSDPVCQTRLFSGYASRYGGWAGSYNFWLSHHWW